MTKPSDVRLHNSTKAYSPFFLSIYDLLAIGIFGRYVWRCSLDNIIGIYKSNISNNHADIGVGTGFFLDKCNLKTSGQRIALFDLNESCLAYSSKRLARFVPEAYVQNAEQDFTIDTPGFDSICIGGLIHCLPGGMSEKCKVFDCIKSITRKDTRVFGYTLVSKGVRKSLLATLLLNILNSLKFVDNLEDSPETLKIEISKRFREQNVTVVGCMACFTAQNYLDPQIQHEDS